MSNAFASKRILCVEDNPDICELVAAILIKYEVLSSDGESDAWKKYESNEFSLIVLDYHLADGDGLELCRRIRRHEPDVPIIFITNDIDLIDETVLAAGGNRLIHKSAFGFIDELLETVETILGEQPAVA